MSNRRIFALLVGIDKYQSPVPPLDGCVNDMRAVRDYLQRHAQKKGIPLHLEVLENQMATRLNIVTKFEQHLTQAGSEDVAFFYYSGHGSQEHAHEYFWKIEEDRKNETLVCYDSRQPDGMDLADKEIATLLDLVAQKDPHIVVIMDACNTGGGTRNLSLAKSRNVNNLPVRVRDLHTYILPRNDQNTRSIAFSSDPSTLVVPNPRHVVMSAAQSFQLAKETYLGGSPRGVFTYSLIEVLEKTVGQLSYNDLMRQVRSLVTKRTTEQMPQLYAPVSGDVDKLFLEGLTSVENNYFALTHNDSDGWNIDGGAIHGIMPPNFSGDTTILNVYGEDATDVEMRKADMALGQVIVTRVLSGKSIVEPQGDLWLDQRSTTYRAKIHTLPIIPIKFYLKADRRIEDAFEARMGSSTYYANFIEKVSTPQEAEYIVYATPNQLVFTLATEDVDQPLFKPVEGNNEQSIREAIDKLVHISQWERTADLTNPGSALSSNSISIELMDKTQDMPLFPSAEGYKFEYDHSRGKEGYPAFRIRITNRSNRRLFCSLMYLGSEFEVMTNLIGNNGGLYLDPGAQAWAINGNELRISVQDGFADIGKSSSTSNFKVVFSTTDFDPKQLELKGLGAPPKMRNVGSGKMNTRALILGGGSSGAFNDWNTNEVPVQVTRLD